MLTNTQIEEALEKLPDERADALLVWRKATIERETIESMLFVDKKKMAMSGGGPAGDDYVKARVRCEESRRLACECEAAAEACFERLDQRLMGAKRQAAVRAAF